MFFGTAEKDVTADLPVGAGAHDRVLKLPPLLPEETDQNRDEAERLTRTAMAHYGHAGREYLTYLLRRVSAEGEGFVLDEIRTARDILRRNLPADNRRGSAGRIASRAAVGMAGLVLFLAAVGAGEEDAPRYLRSFLAGWEMVLEGIPSETVAEAALAAVQDYVATHAEQIRGLREEDPEHPRPPARWAGAVMDVQDDAGQKVRVVALTETAFAEAVAREPFDLDPHHALQALVGAGHVVTRTEKKPDGRTTVRAKPPVRVAKTVARCVCVPVGLVLPALSSSAPASEDTVASEPLAGADF